MDRKKLSRRDFLRLSAAAASGMLVAACAPAAPGVVEVEKEVPVEKIVVQTVEVEKEVVVEKEVIKEVPAKLEKAKVTFWVEAPAEERRKVIREQYQDTFNAAHDDIEHHG